MSRNFSTRKLLKDTDYPERMWHQKLLNIFQNMPESWHTEHYTEQAHKRRINHWLLEKVRTEGKLVEIGSEAEYPEPTYKLEYTQEEDSWYRITGVYAVDANGLHGITVFLVE